MVTSFNLELPYLSFRNTGQDIYQSIPGGRIIGTNDYAPQECDWQLTH